MGGYGWSENVNVAGITIGTPMTSKAAFVGGTLGYNWQTPVAVRVCIEADVLVGHQIRRHYSGVTSETDPIVRSVTGRLGYAAIPPDLLQGRLRWATTAFRHRCFRHVSSRKASFTLAGPSWRP